METQVGDSETFFFFFEHQQIQAHSAGIHCEICEACRHANADGGREQVFETDALL